jgi:type IV pilus assembly protein PilE
MKKLVQQKGFTLVEIMIVVVILGVVAAFAMPAYKESVSKARRVDAQSALVSLAAALERNYTVRSTYLGTNTGSDANGSIPSSTVFPSEAPLEGDVKFYDLRMVLTADSYVLLAIPKGGQVGDGRIRLSSTNQRGWDKLNNGTFSSSW